MAKGRANYIIILVLWAQGLPKHKNSLNTCPDLRLSPFRSWKKFRLKEMKAWVSIWGNMIFRHKSFSIKNFLGWIFRTVAQTLTTTTAYLSFVLVGSWEHVNKGPTTASTHVQLYMCGSASHDRLPLLLSQLFLKISTCFAQEHSHPKLCNVYRNWVEKFLDGYSRLELVPDEIYCNEI